MSNTNAVMAKTRTRVIVDFFPHVNSDVYLDRLGTTPLLTFSAAPHDEIRLLLKRVSDVVLAGWIGLNNLTGGGGPKPFNKKAELQAPKQPAEPAKADADTSEQGTKR